MLICKVNAAVSGHQLETSPDAVDGNDNIQDCVYVSLHYANSAIAFPPSPIIYRSIMVPQPFEGPKEDYGSDL